MRKTQTINFYQFVRNAGSPLQELNLVIEAYWQVWKALDAQIKKLDEELKQQAQEDPNEKIYRSAPGIGPLGARILSNELGDMSQFNNERQLFSYTGLTQERTFKQRQQEQGSDHAAGEQSSPMGVMRSCLESNKKRRKLERLF